MKVAKLATAAFVPTRGTEGSAGLDLYSIESIKIEPGQRALVATGIAVAIPDGCVGHLNSRSGLAAKHGIFVLNAPGIIDSDYRGEIKVILYNSSLEPFNVEVGMRIGQLVVLEYKKLEPELVESLSETVRGAGGFGSTGN